MNTSNHPTLSYGSLDGALTHHQLINCRLAADPKRPCSAARVRSSCDIYGMNIFFRGTRLLVASSENIMFGNGLFVLPIIIHINTNAGEENI